MLPGATSATQPQDFWVWFQQNRDFLQSYATNTQAVTRAVGGRLQRVDRGLTYELGQAGDGVYEFIVSANGIRDVFPEVLRLVRVAPKIEGWRIIAFRPRRPNALASRLDYAGMSMSGEDIWYRSEDGGGEFNLTVYIRGLEPANEKTAVGAAFLMLDLALGEYDVATKLRSIDFAPLPPDPAALGLRPLNDLPREVDARFPASEN